MPVVDRFSHCTVRIHGGDHPPPHLHVLLNDGREALIDIRTLRVMRGSVVAREIAVVLEWMATQREWLLARFEDLQG